MNRLARYLFIASLMSQSLLLATAYGAANGLLHTFNTDSFRKSPNDCRAIADTVITSTYTTQRGSNIHAVVRIRNHDLTTHDAYDRRRPTARPVNYLGSYPARLTIYWRSHMLRSQEFPPYFRFV
jgi:hypothetical protein